jgi:peptidoglycan/LPS O-acetylase OafA/YrhL
MNLWYDKWSLLASSRFVLASVVAINHLGDYAALGWMAVIPRFGAFEAILGFLVISGFSIGSSYSKQPQGFLGRRAWRIWPVYFVAIAVTLLAQNDHVSASLLVVLAENSLFLNQLTTTQSYVGPAWSLSLEVWLYCLTPWLASRSTRIIRAMICVSFLSSCCYEVCRSALHLPYYSAVGLGLNLLFLSFAWLCGFAMSRPGVTSTLLLKDCGWLFFGYLLLAVVIQAIFRWKHGQFALLLQADIPGFALRAATLAVIYLVFRAIVRGEVGNGQSSILRLLGDISYPLYLIHIPVFILANRVLGSNAMLLFAAGIMSATVIYYAVDGCSRRRERALASRIGPSADEICLGLRAQNPPKAQDGAV